MGLGLDIGFWLPILRMEGFLMELSSEHVHILFFPYTL